MRIRSYRHISVTKMRPFFCPKLVTVPDEVSSIPDQDTNKSCVPYLRENNAENISTFRLVPVGRASEEFRVNVSSWKKTHPIRQRTVSRPVPESTISDNFQFDQKWRNGMFSKNNFRDGGLMKAKPIFPPVSQDFQNHRSNNLNKLSHQKELFYGITKPCSFGYRSYEECDSSSLPSVLLSVTTPNFSAANNVTGSFKNRPRLHKRGCNHFPTGFNTSTPSYPDPAPGAPASFIQRLLEISSLEGDTVHEEKMKNLKKNRRQES